ncbi:MAG TPA: type IV secretion system DNA-binding domain-containing protein [Candidatus Binatia bacterium]|jgi:type IV secretory pathway TraG/TraD family ATPase VirD4|nr:type IV secretion system DNA-binding domain-containing protein [Candidatus Binatia bacterium]
MTAHIDNSITFFAKTNFRNRGKIFGIKQADRRAHIYLLGRTGVGKSSLLETFIHQDIASGQGLALFDPHGDLAERVLAAIPPERQQDLIYFNVPDGTRPLGFNPLECIPPDKRPLAASSLLEVFKKIWNDSWGPRLEHILRNAILALLEQPESTLADVLHLLSDRVFRKETMANVYNPQVREFWLQEYESYTPHFRIEAIAPIQNKVGAFLANPLLNSILTQPRSAFDVRRIMDEGKILLVNLAKGKIGEDTAALLGALLVSRIGMAALSRAEVPEEGRRDFFVYLDEFPTFTTLSLAGALSELRKYRVGLILAHQYLTQLDLEVRDAILGNVGTIISFRIGVTDAEILEKEFYPEITAVDLINLPNHDIYLKLMIDGVVSRPFSATTLPPSPLPGL